MRFVINTAVMIKVAFPLTPALSRGERENGFQSWRKIRGWIRERCLQNTGMFSRCSLSPRERVRVRGKAAEMHLRINEQDTHLQLL
jgi:hypothetical protein